MVSQIVAGPTPRLALPAMAADEPVLAEKVSMPGENSTLSEALTPGFRAVSLRSNDIAGVGGFRPARRPRRRAADADQAATGTKAEHAVTQAVAENVLVLGVDQSDAETNKPVVAKAITIEVTPDTGAGDLAWRGQ